MCIFMLLILENSGPLTLAHLSNFATPAAGGPEFPAPVLARKIVRAARSAGGSSRLNASRPE
jgi:hypothetical protein